MLQPYAKILFHIKLHSIPHNDKAKTRFSRADVKKRKALYLFLAVLLSSVAFQLSLNSFLFCTSSPFDNITLVLSVPSEFPYVSGRVSSAESERDFTAMLKY